MDTQSDWYLVYTKPHQEFLAKENLERQGFNVYLPILQNHRRIRNLYRIVLEPLFPRYLFVHSDHHSQQWNKIRSTRGCISLVQFGFTAATIPFDLIENIKKVERNQLLESEEKDVFKPGDWVRVIDGILANYEGVVEAKSNHDRITLLLTIAEGHTKKVSLSIHQVHAVGK